MVSHAALDTMLFISIGLVLYVWSDPTSLLMSAIDWLSSFPNHYEPVFDFIKEPMSPALAISLWIIDMYFLIKTYVVERSIAPKINAVDMVCST